jgi:DNA-damage-inducible protein J
MPYYSSLALETANVMLTQNNHQQFLEKTAKVCYAVKRKGENDMANTTNVNVRVDEDLKRQAEYVFSELGMNLSTALNLFLHSAVRYGGIPFDLRIHPKPPGLEGMSKAEIDAKLEKGFASMKSGRGRPANEVFNELEKEFAVGKK